MRVSSPSLAAAFIAGAREQGADVVDYGMIATDMIYYAVGTDDLDGGAQITASHNPKQYNGCKMVGRGNMPLSGDAGISDIRDMIAGEPHSARPPQRRRAAPSDRSSTGTCKHVLGFIDPSIIKPYKVVLDAGCGMAGLVAPALFKALPCKVDALCFAVDGTFPTHEANPLDRGKPARHRRAGQGRPAPKSASPGTATPIAASSSTKTASSSRAIS